MIAGGRRHTLGDIRRFTCADISVDIRRGGLGGDRVSSRK